jgi:hypothetical protein
MASVDCGGVRDSFLMRPIGGMFSASSLTNMAGREKFRGSIALGKN